MGVTVKTVLDTALAELGYRESPPGSNRTKYGKWYGLDGQPWCMMFVQWVFHRVGGADLLPVRTASCGALMRAAQAAGKWVTEDYRSGDVVIFDFSGKMKRTDHVGIVIERRGGSLYTIEGNTADGNNSNGGQVLTRLRSLSVVRGALRPDYEEESSMDNTPSGYAVEAIKWAKENGILFGDVSGNLRLHDPVTREQALTFLYRFAKSMGKA